MHHLLSDISHSSSALSQDLYSIRLVNEREHESVESSSNCTSVETDRDCGNLFVYLIQQSDIACGAHTHKLRQNLGDAMIWSHTMRLGVLAIRLKLKLFVQHRLATI